MPQRKLRQMFTVFTDVCRQSFRFGIWPILVSVDYQFIRRVVDRSKLDPYEVFRIRKRNSDGYRIICAPEWQLLATQRWIAQNILRYARSHTASYAFAPQKKIKDAAVLHCEAKWLIKMDVRRFFESISEIAAYKVFNKLGIRATDFF